MNDQKVLVAGIGKSGIAAAKLLLKMGGEVVLYDGNDSLDKDAVKAQFGDASRLTVILGDVTRPDLLGVELAIISPGIPLGASFVPILDEAKIPIWGEVQLAYHVAKGRLAAITGTNGKTTTTALAGEIMKAHFQQDSADADPEEDQDPRVFVVGNIGIPYTETALKTTEESVTVAEISSFQLETIMDFRPDVSAILNITPDHLNRHGTMENYIEVKERIASNQTEDDSIILNYDDAILREFGESDSLKAKVVYFSSSTELKEGLFLRDSSIIYRKNGTDTEVVDVRDLHLLGRHNYENVMAAAAIARQLDVPMETISSAARAFQAVEHRIEFVLERSGVRYYNDSKGTNPDAAIQAIQAMPGPTLLIAGGYDKDSEYDAWIDTFGEKVKYLVLLGQTRDKIAACARAHGFAEIMYAEDMAEAVRVCAAYANSGDNVLLSPACASWGMYDNYEQRGDVFKECVRNL
ncbi:MAG: UDP-N-acetylmuramoyl-L-alanine--D-glutamate ligase [Lachnospiraceae bacterium]